MNAVDILLLALIGLAVGLALRKLRRGRKAGKGCLGCGGSCGSCSMDCGKRRDQT